MKSFELYTKPSVSTVLLRTAMVLLCLVVLSASLVVGLFAKYSSSASGDDSARVAAFNVEVVGGNKNVRVDVWPQTNDNQYKISIYNKSEVSVTYDITVTCSEQVKGLSVKMGSETKSLNNENKQAKFDPPYIIPPNTSKSYDHTLTFLVDWDQFTEDYTGNIATQSLTFTVTVHVEQVD